jgi:hypothetical protein
MVAKFKQAALIGFIVLAGVGAGTANAQDQSLELGTLWKGNAPASSDKPWVNVLFRDFEGAGGIFEWINNTVEVQVTTGSEDYPPLPSDPIQCCTVEGNGHLTANETLKSLYLNVNPRIDISKLKLYWTGNSMPPGAGQCDAGICADKFPAAGLEPSNIAIGTNRFRVPGGCAFDILIEWKGQQRMGRDSDHSKLLLVYDDATQSITKSDFLIASDVCPDNVNVPIYGAAHVQTPNGGGGAGWIKDGIQQ